MCIQLTETGDVIETYIEKQIIICVFYNTIYIYIEWKYIRQLNMGMIDWFWNKELMIVLPVER